MLRFSSSSRGRHEVVLQPVASYWRLSKEGSSIANRRYNNQQFTMVPGAVSLFAYVTFGSTGAPTLSTAASKGIISVTRNSAGNYTFLFGTKAGMPDVYNSLLMVNQRQISSSAQAAPEFRITANNVSSTTAPGVTVQYSAAGSATDPASGEIGLFEFDLKNSSAP